jgi:hypothetical protein
MDCTLENRIKKYNKVFYFSNIAEFNKLIYEVKQDYLYTIDPHIYYNKF